MFFLLNTCRYRRCELLFLGTLVMIADILFHVFLCFLSPRESNGFILLIENETLKIANFIDVSMFIYLVTLITKTI